MVIKTLKNKILFFVIFSLSLSAAEVKDLSTLKILTPSLATRKTKKIRLENGLEAYLISDPSAKNSAAAMAVKTGSFDDPEDRPGMAHFIEHMLFMGTEKFPEEEAYHSFLNTHGGKCNAFTCEDRTVYSFSCDNSHFKDGLDRFSSLFISPLFRTSSLQREAHAIDQEFCKDLPLDMWRVHYVKKELANPLHPFHHFCIGNKETLSVVTSEELHNWYNTHYSSDQMHLVVYSKESMESLERSVESYFSLVPKREVQKVFSKQPIFLEEIAKKIVNVTPLNQLKTLELSWELPECFSNEKEYHADDIVSFVLGHEGEKSLFDSLKKHELAHGLSVKTEHIGRNKSLFTMSVELTEEGIHSYDKVLNQCFHAIDYFASVELPKYIYDEMCEMRKTRYAFQSREESFDYVTELSYAMVDEALETFPEKTVMFSRFDREQLQKFWNQLKRDNCHVTLIADPSLIQTVSTHKEKWMGTEYAFLPLKNEKIVALSDVDFPTPNPFLPKNLTLQNEAGESNKFPIPKVLLQNDSGIYLFAADDRFLTPEISWTFSYKTPLINAKDPKTVVLADLFIHAFEKKLNALSYAAKLAGLQYSLTSKENGIHIKITGFSEKASECLKTLLTEMKQFRPDAKEFAEAVAFFKDDYKNRLDKTPISQAMDLVSTVLYKNSVPLSSKLKALKQVKSKELGNFSENLFLSGYVEGMLYGNMKEMEAKSLVEEVSATWNVNSYPPSQHFKKALANLPEDKSPSFFNKKSDQPSNVVVLMVDCGPFSFQKKAALDVLSKGLKEPFFSELRTKQQTGYLVSLWSQEIEKHLYLFLVTQSSTHDTRDLISRFELFIESTLVNLKENVIPLDRFTTIKESFVTALEHPAENITDMGELLFGIAFDYDRDFTYIDQEIEAIKALSYETFQTEARQFIGKQNTKRLAICLNGKLSPLETLSYRKVANLEKLKESIKYEEKK